MSVPWITRKKKSELLSLCDQLGLPTDGQLKSGLETLLIHHLQENEKELSSDSTFAAYYVSSARSPVKRTSIAVKTEETPSSTRVRRQTAGHSSLPADEETGSAYSETESTVDRKARVDSSTPGTRTPRTARLLLDAEAAATQLLPTPMRDTRHVELSSDVITLTTVPSPAVLANGVSPAVVTDNIERSANAIMASAREVVQRAEIRETATGVRDKLSNVISVNVASLSIEAALLFAAVIPITYEITLPAIDTIGYPSTRYIVPDLFVLLTTSFWAPFMVWLLTTIVLPGLNAVVFNLVSTSNKEGAAYKADPLTYSVTRALCVYLVHYKGFTFGGLLGQAAVANVGNTVGRELQMIGAAIGGIAALWVGILAAR